MARHMEKQPDIVCVLIASNQCLLCSIGKSTRCSQIIIVTKPNLLGFTYPCGLFRLMDIEA